MKLYHHPLSGSARRVTLTAAFLNIDYDSVLVDLPAQAHYAEDYRSLNPNRKVPTLVDGGVTLWESHAIMIYLAEGKPDQVLWPTSRAERAQILKWLFWANQYWYPTSGTLGYENWVKPMLGRGEPDAAVVERANHELRGYAQILENQLQGREFLVNDQFSLADLALVSTILSGKKARLPIEDFASIQAWLRRIQELPEWQNASAKVDRFAEELLANLAEQSVPSAARR